LPYRLGEESLRTSLWEGSNNSAGRVNWSNSVKKSSGMMSLLVVKKDSKKVSTLERDQKSRKSSRTERRSAKRKRNRTNSLLRQVKEISIFLRRKPVKNHRKEERKRVFTG